LKFRAIKGTKDILPEEVTAWQQVEATIRRVMHDFNYREIRTPVFEQTGLFARSIGAYSLASATTFNGIPPAKPVLVP